MSTKKRLLPGTEVRIRWVDSSSMDAGWVYTTNPIKDLPLESMKTVGIVVLDTKEGISITHSRTDSTYGIFAPFSIPRGCIRSIEIIKEPDEDRQF